MHNPTPGQQRCMIYAHPTRALDDGCGYCGQSAVYCAANRTLNHGQDCCPSCTH